MANLIVVGAQWGDEGKGPPETPHRKDTAAVCPMDPRDAGRCCGTDHPLNG